MTANQIAFRSAIETERANRAKEAENYRSNLAKESETKRSNLATEQETRRSNLRNEQLTDDKNIVGTFGNVGGIVGSLITAGGRIISGLINRK